MSNNINCEYCSFTCGNSRAVKESFLCPQCGGELVQEDYEEQYELDEYEDEDNV